MPDTTSPDGPEPQPNAPKQAGKARLLVIGVLCLGLAAGGYVLGGKLGGGQPAAAAPVPTPAPAPTVGEIVDLDGVNVNLADGHYLRIAVSLGLVAHATEAAAESSDHGTTEEADGVLFPTAPVADLVLATFAGRTMESLADEAGRESARADLLAGIHNYYGDEEILTVFFTEFVMQ